MWWPDVVLGMAFAILGALFHFGKKSRRSEIEATLVDYFFKSAPYSTAQAFFSMLLTIVVLISQDQVDVSTVGGLLMMIAVGYSLDSAINKFKTTDDMLDLTLGAGQVKGMPK
jgi:hypothetical protein